MAAENGFIQATDPILQKLDKSTTQWVSRRFCFELTLIQAMRSGLLEEDFQLRAVNKLLHDEGGSLKKRCKQHVHIVDSPYMSPVLAVCNFRSPESYPRPFEHPKPINGAVDRLRHLLSLPSYRRSVIQAGPTVPEHHVSALWWTCAPTTNFHGFHDLSAERCAAREEMIQALIQAGDDPNQVVGETLQCTAMHRACYHGMGVNVVRSLLEAGGHPNVRSNRNQTPLHMTLARVCGALGNNPELLQQASDVVYALLMAGADRDLRSSLPPDKRPDHFDPTGRVTVLREFQGPALPAIALAGRLYGPLQNARPSNRPQQNRQIPERLEY